MATYWFQGKASGNTKMTGLSATEYLDLIKREEEIERQGATEQEALAREAALGPQVSAGIRAYEAVRGQPQDQPIIPPQPEPEGQMIGAGTQPQRRFSAARFGEPGFEETINAAVQEQQAATEKPFESLRGDSGSMMSRMAGTTYEGFTEPQMRKERQMSGPMLQLLEDVPQEMADDLIAQYRMGTLKADGLTKQLISIKKTLREDAAAKKKEAFSSKLKIGEEAAKQEAMTGREEKKIESEEEIKRMQDETDRYIADLNNRTKLELERMKQDKAKGGKADKEVKGLMDLKSAFDQLKEEHSGIWTGPVAGTIGKLNITGVERAKFNATRAQVLKTIAKAFEGARMSDIDMKFYERMIPKDTHTQKQFDGIRESMLNLVDWRIKRFNETGEDPGAAPPEAPEPAGADGATDLRALAQQAIDDPEATPEEKAQARKILGIQ